jgi:hypothetical protein
VQYADAGNVATDALPSYVRKVLEPANPPFGVFKGRTTLPVEVNAQRLRVELENVSGIPAVAVTGLSVETDTVPGVELGQGGFDVPVGKTMVFNSESILAETPLGLRVTIDVQNDAAVAARFYGVRLERIPTPIIRSRPWELNAS